MVHTVWVGMGGCVVDRSTSVRFPLLSPNPTENLKSHSILLYLTAQTSLLLGSRTLFEHLDHPISCHPRLLFPLLGGLGKPLSLHSMGLVEISS